jgi:hypothetical protein
VEQYDVSTGTLVLKHNYPPSERPTSVHVNVDIVLETLQKTSLAVGAWLNVVGYTTQKASLLRSSIDTVEASALKDDTNAAYVQAIILWDAGAVKLDAYERALQGRIWLGTTG